jgi:hypothetical protein
MSFPKTKVYVVSLDLSLVFKSVFGIVLVSLICLKSIKQEMPENFYLRTQGILWYHFLNLVFIGRFSFQNDNIKLPKVFSELRIRIFLENGQGSLQALLILQIWDEPEKLNKFWKQIWRLNSKPKCHVTYTLVWLLKNNLFSFS